MIYQKKTINNVATKVPLSNSAPVGNPIGTIISTYKKIQPRNYLYCDGSTFDEDQYPALYLYLGTNVLPDYRECAIVGAEKNTTDVFDSTETDPSTGLPGTQSHDVYTQGEFKDDQIQDFTIGISAEGTNTNRITKGSNTTVGTTTVSEISPNIRSGTVTHGKRKAVYYYIKAIDGVDISDEDTFLNIVKDYVDESLSYSTTEQKTGGKWIDEKDIWKRTFQYNNKSISGSSWNLIDSQFPITFANITKVNCHFIASDIAIGLLWHIEGTQLKVWENIASRTGTIIFEVEYTKD